MGWRRSTPRRTPPPGSGWTSACPDRPRRNTPHTEFDREDTQALPAPGAGDLRDLRRPGTSASRAPRRFEAVRDHQHGSLGGRKDRPEGEGFSHREPNRPPDHANPPLQSRRRDDRRRHFARREALFGPRRPCRTATACDNSHHDGRPPAREQPHRQRTAGGPGNSPRGHHRPLWRRAAPLRRPIRQHRPHGGAEDPPSRARRRSPPRRGGAEPELLPDLTEPRRRTLSYAGPKAPRWNPRREPRHPRWPRARDERH